MREQDPHEGCSEDVGRSRITAKTMTRKAAATVFWRSLKGSAFYGPAFFGICLLAWGCSSAGSASSAKTPPFPTGTIRWVSTGATWTATASGFTYEISKSVARMRQARFQHKGRSKEFLYDHSDALGGGHRSWLLPQYLWGPDWPPPKPWETTEATSTRVSQRGRQIRFQLKAVPDWPKKSRSYTIIEPGKLELTSEWSGGIAGSVHILQVPFASEIFVQLESPSPSSPVAVLPFLPHKKNQILKEDLPKNIRRVPGGFLVTAGREAIKLGFHRATLTARLPDGSEVILHPGTWTKAPEHPSLEQDFPTQIYLSTKENPFLEIEQTSPSLDATRRPVSLTAMAEFIP